MVCVIECINSNIDIQNSEQPIIMSTLYVFKDNEPLCVESPEVVVIDGKIKTVESNEDIKLDFIDIYVKELVEKKWKIKISNVDNFVLIPPKTSVCSDFTSGYESLNKTHLFTMRYKMKLFIEIHADHYIQLDENITFTTS